MKNPFCSFCIQLSYIVVDLLVWWGIRGIINDFRKRKLKLPPIAYFSTYHGSISHLPTGYMWSSHVVPKPSGKTYSFTAIYCLFSYEVFMGYVVTVLYLVLPILVKRNFS